MGRARKRFGQHFLEPAWVDQGHRAIDPAPDRRLRRDRTGPRRADASAGRARQARHRLRDRSRSGRGSDGRRPAERHRRRRATSSRRRRLALRVERSRVRVAGNLPYNVASPILFKLVDWFRDRRPARRRDADAAARGRRPAGRRAGHARVRRPDRADSARRRRASGSSRSRPAPFGPRRRSSRRSFSFAFTRPDPAVQDHAVFTGTGAGGLHAAPQDARECPPGVRSSGSPLAARGPRAGGPRRPAPPGDADHRRVRPPVGRLRR